jgi:hypothetical protein
MCGNSTTGASYVRQASGVKRSGNSPPAARSDDARRARLRERLEIIRARSQKSSSWRSVTHYFAGLVNREGVVPVRARLTREDLRFLASARDELLAFCELGLRLLDLHQPRGASGISSDPGNPIRRCRACMSRWPCPTVRAIEETVDRPPGS